MSALTEEDIKQLVKEEITDPLRESPPDHEGVTSVITLVEHLPTFYILLSPHYPINTHTNAQISVHTHPHPDQYAFVAYQDSELQNEKTFSLYLSLAIYGNMTDEAIEWDASTWLQSFGLVTGYHHPLVQFAQSVDKLTDKGAVHVLSLPDDLAHEEGICHIGFIFDRQVYFHLAFHWEQMMSYDKRHATLH